MILLGALIVAAVIVLAVIAVQNRPQGKF